MAALRHCAPVVLALSALAMSVAGPMRVNAAASWTLSIAPSSANLGASTAFTLTATNVEQGGRIGCVNVNVPASFSISSVAIIDSTDGVWSIAQAGGNAVQANAAGNERLDFQQQVRFRVTATPTQAGTWAWTSFAKTSFQCEGQPIPGDAPAVVVTGAPSTPAPPPPTPQPTPRPTAAPTANPGPGATAAPGGGGGPGGPPVTETPRPNDATPSPSPSATATSSPSSGSSGEPSELPSGNSTPGSSGDGVRVRVPSAQVPFQVIQAADEIELTGVSMALRGGAFAVPAAAIAGPGLLLLVWFGLQAVGAASWLPAMRRLRGDDQRPRRGGLR